MEISKDKIQVLQKSLLLERAMSELLCFLLEIQPINKSRVFGNTSGAMSFKQKVDLIIDTKGISEKKSKEASEKFVVFMELRNSFMHNIDVIDFSYYFENLSNGKDNLKKLKRWYKKEKSKEIGNEYDILFDFLFEQLRSFTNEIWNEYYNRLTEKIKNIGSSRIVGIVHNTMKEIRADFNKLPFDKDEIKSVFESQDCKGFGDFFYLAFMNKFNDNCEKDLNEFKLNRDKV